MLPRCLSETACLSLGLEQNENVTLADGSLDVADDGAGGVVQELNADLSDTTTRAGAAEALGDAGKLNGLLH